MHAIIPPYPSPLFPGGGRSRDVYYSDINKLTSGQVTDYLLKRGYTHTEAVFRKEVQNVDPSGRPLKNNDEMGPKKYMRAFTHLEKWVENSLDLYKVCHLRVSLRPYLLIHGVVRAGQDLMAYLRLLLPRAG